MLFVVLIGGTFLARRNLRLSRSDRRAATIVAIFVLAAGLLAWALQTHHVASNGESDLFIRGLSLVVLVACACWIFYLAIEPYVRRLWPHALVSWDRQACADLAPWGFAMDRITAPGKPSGSNREAAGLIAASCNVLFMLAPSCVLRILAGVRTMQSAGPGDSRSAEVGSVQVVPPEAHEVTCLLARWREGDEGAFHQLVPIVYGELRRVARRYLGRERSDNTLQPTDLAHEVYLRLARQGGRVDWQDRVHFFALAATLMRRILVEHARRKRAVKREAHHTSLSVSDGAGASGPMSIDVLTLHEALERLGTMDPRQARVVELRFFGGLSVEEAGEALRLSPATVKREWQIARLWLHRELNANPHP